MTETASLRVVAAIIFESDQVYCFKRGASKYTYLHNKYEFPGGKVEAGETLEEALRREVMEELGVHIDIEAHFLSTTHQYPEFTAEVTFFTCRLRQPATELSLHDHTEVQLLPVDRLTELDWLAGSELVIRKLAGAHWRK